MALEDIYPDENEVLLHVGEFYKNVRETVHVKIKKFRGHVFLDIRCYFMAGDTEWTATKKGVAIPLAAIPRLQEFIEAARNAADEMRRKESNGSNPKPEAP